MWTIIPRVTPTISASAPTRIDLAGGTLDIWPLCHLLERPALTVNMAIDLRAKVDLEEARDGYIEIHSEDRGVSARMPAGEIRHDQLGIASRMAEWFGTRDGLRIRLRSTAPPQAGLGGSSALAVALAGAFCAMRGIPHDGEQFRALVQNIETAELRSPTGYQDYYPAILGGASAIRATPGGVQVEPLTGAGDFLGRHLLLADTGISHHSGLTNWEVVRRFLDGERAVRESLCALADCAAAMREAVVAGDLNGVAVALGREWQLRRTLSPAVSNERIERIVAASADAGALAAKVCGAGGGGCLVLLVADATDQAVLKAVAAAGGTPVTFRPDPVGLTVAGGSPATPDAASGETCPPV
ncbi:MAG: GHMP family kinase ATP-binding protein [Planctomycetota bacterium]|jgi:D-glycero-alpha-D-manno-heptose-7-phosphate kinase